MRLDNPLTWLAAIFFLPFVLRAQYLPPLEGPLLITGTFGELRSDHFHGGLDFRAAVGTPVLAVHDGYVSRIKVTGGGYGQAIYVDHPDGKRSVYGHLEALAPEFKDTIRKLQYARESFEIDLYLDSLAFPVAQGQRIGQVGNRGYSFGPHLHFEIRESAGDVPLNPLSLGFDVADTRRPNLLRIRIYELDRTDDRVIDSHEFDLGRRGLPDTLRVGSSRIGIGIKAHDRQNAMPNRNGIYRADLLLDSARHFSFVYDRIPYDKTEYLNALTDFREWKDRRSWYYLLYARTPEAVFWPGGDSSRTGQIDLLPDKPVRVHVRIADHAGNETEADLVLLHSTDLAPATPPAHQYFLPAGEASVIDTGGMRLELGKDAIYDDVYFTYAKMSDDSEGYLSDTYQLHTSTTPLHGRAELYLRPRRPVTDSLQQHVYVGKCNSGKAPQSVGGEWQPDGTVMARIGSFGDYALFSDTTAPTIEIERFGTDLRGRNEFSLLLEEEAGGRLNYRATVDDEWILMEYDAKSGRLSHTFEGGRIGEGQHTFQLTVTDERGNAANFSRSFRR